MMVDVNQALYDAEPPVIPAELLVLDCPDGFDGECIKLWQAVLHELLDMEYLARQHHNTGTHDRGCRGPLCKKAYREHPRRKTPEGFSGYTPREERVYDPILEFYHTVGKHRIKKFKQSIHKELAG